MSSASQNPGTPPHRIVALARGAEPIPLRPAGDDWVSKTDLTNYLRCPYAYSLLYRGEIDPSDLIGPGLGRFVSELFFNKPVRFDRLRWC